MRFAKSEPRRQRMTAEELATRTTRLDAAEKLLGTGEFVDDMQVAGMLHGAVLRSQVSARTRQDDRHLCERSCTRAWSSVLTAKDVPGERLLGHIVHDWPVMIAEGEETRYVGDALALLAATTKEAARQALELIHVEYEELPALLSPQAALLERCAAPSSQRQPAV